MSHTQAVAIVEAQESISKLAEEDTWIYTYTSGVIRDVIASPSSLPLRIGGRVVLRSDGGDVIIGGKTLRVRPGTAPYRAQHRYLVFFSVGSEDASLAVPLASLEVTVPGHWGVCL